MSCLQVVGTSLRITDPRLALQLEVTRESVIEVVQTGILRLPHMQIILASALACLLLLPVACLLDACFKGGDWDWRLLDRSGLCFWTNTPVRPCVRTAWQSAGEHRTANFCHQRASEQQGPADKVAPFPPAPHGTGSLLLMQSSGDVPCIWVG
ncbi:hypothetical protein BJ170DRAFT_190161 [Xylariales sp. AK1849]|nr:hypothetical protein BJ170DRAFT_190161 [Xylariales sp. AK1849]